MTIYGVTGATGGFGSHVKKQQERGPGRVSDGCRGQQIPLRVGSRTIEVPVRLHALAGEDRADTGHGHVARAGAGVIEGDHRSASVPATHPTENPLSTRPNPGSSVRPRRRP